MTKLGWSFVCFSIFLTSAWAGNVDDFNGSCGADAKGYASLDGYICGTFSKVKKECYIAECTPEGDGDAKWAVCDHGRIVGVDGSSGAANDACNGRGDDGSGSGDSASTSGDDDNGGRGKDSARVSGDSSECKKIKDALSKLRDGDNSQDGSIAYWEGKAKDKDCDLEADNDTGGSGGSSGGSSSGDGHVTLRGGGSGSLDLALYGSSDDDYVRTKTEPDCYECTIYRGYQESKASGTADVITAIGYGLGQLAGPAAQVWSNHMWSNAYENVQSKWALTASNAQDQCTERFNNYLSSIDSYGGSPWDSASATRFSKNCNGVPTYAYAGQGGMMGGMGMGGMYGGSSNPWLSAGYSPGMMQGMMGPYGMNGGINLGMSYPGYGYGYPSGGVGFGMGGYMGAGGFPPYLGGSWGMGGYAGAGGYGYGGGTGYGSYPYSAGTGFSGGITMGIGTGGSAGINPYGGSYGNPYGYGGMSGGYGVGSGVMPYYGMDGGSYFNNSGGWGDQYSQWQTQYAQQMAYQQQMAAVGARTGYDMYGNAYGNMALQQGAYGTMQGYGSSYGGGYGGSYGNQYYGNPYASTYGSAGYGMGGMSAQFGFNF